MNNEEENKNKDYASLIEKNKERKRRFILIQLMSYIPYYRNIERNLKQQLQSNSAYKLPPLVPCYRLLAIATATNT